MRQVFKPLSLMEMIEIQRAIEELKKKLIPSIDEREKRYIEDELKKKESVIDELKHSFNI